MKITTLFCDLGGVLLTNGWDHNSRKKASETFGFDLADFDSRHALMFGDYEEGKISLHDYLHHSLFYKPRTFTIEAFIDFMYAQSKAYPEMIEYVQRLKRENQFKLVIISNEGRELTDFRMQKFGLRKFADYFIVSCFVHLRKPDSGIYRMALDMVQVPPEQIIYLEDRQLFVEIAQEMGINSIRHLGLDSTQKAVQAILTA